MWYVAKIPETYPMVACPCNYFRAFRPGASPTNGRWLRFSAPSGPALALHQSAVRGSFFGEAGYPGPGRRRRRGPERDQVPRQHQVGRAHEASQARVAAARK